MQINMRLQVGKSVGFFVAFSLALFLPAGTFAWLAGWIFLILFFGFYLAVNLWLFRHNPGLMQERLRLSTSDQQGWDKVLFPLMLIFPFVWMAFMSLDAVRFHWSSMPALLQVVGGIILLCSFYILFLTFRKNSYLSPVVRHQEDRNQKVVSTGTYHYVRHPMYMGILLFTAGTSFLLGSWYGFLFGIIFMVIIARRSVLEEQMLQNMLSGYVSYMTQVKYRLIPDVW
jgi:protein-S-isoprenylcysteine O-methyltransferase Ste14